MSKPSSSAARNPQVFEHLKSTQPANDIDFKRNNEYREQETPLSFELDVPKPVLHSVTIQRDGNQVLSFLNSNSYTEQVYGDFEQRKTEYSIDRDFAKPQVTRESLVQDGRDIVKYLELNRYAEDMNSKLDEYDVNSIVQEFQESLEDGDIDRLEKAVDRLHLLRKHLSSKL
jgi:hypothetical protein